MIVEMDRTNRGTVVLSSEVSGQGLGSTTAKYRE